MSELRIIPADQARALREELGAIRETPILRGRHDEGLQEMHVRSRYDRLAGEHAENLAHTVEQQDEKIKRLQEAVRDADWVAGELAGVELIPRLINREIITEEDMQ